MGLIKGILKIGLVLILVLVVALGGIFTWLVVRGMPQRDGTASLPGLSAPVQVIRDANGIANIYASTTEDLFAAQGYVHASERMWQMEVWRRIGAGRLSELFGDTSLGEDRYIRTLGWRQAAEADLEVLSDEARAAIEAYAGGVNAWLDQHGDLPLPFVISGFLGAGGGLSGFRPEPWTVLDTLTWQKVQAWSLGDNYGTEMMRGLMLNHGLTEEQILELAPGYDGTRPVIISNGAAHETPAIATSQRPQTHLGATSAGEMLDAAARLRSTIALAGAGAALGGSNGFAVSPEKSATGAAMLANDPHLDHSMPSLWYLVGLHCQPVGPECPYELAGAGFPGVPGIVLGHNERIAWGLTNVGPDVQDVFEETVDPDDDTRYMYKGESRPFEVRQETIEVAGGDPVTLDVRSTVHGPVMSDVETDFDPTDDGGAGLGRDGYVYSLAWTATSQVDRTLDSLLAVNRAQNWDEFRQALELWGSPSQTLLYADVDGHIGIQIPGLMPIRASADGQFIVPGESGEYDWTGFVPYEELPYAFDPAEGYIVASNNQVTAPGVGPYIGRDFDPGFRAARITELLESGDLLTADGLRAVQGDVKLTRAAPVAAVLGDVTAATADGETLRQRIVDWQADLECGTASLGCAAYETFEYWLQRGTLDDELGSGSEPENTAWRYVGSEASHDFMVRLVDQPDGAWWDDTSTENAVETRDDVIAAALDRAASELRTALDDPQGWTWGKIHTITLQEQTLGTSGIAPLEWIFNKGPFPAPGSCTTVNKICGRTAGEWPMEGEAPDLQLRFSASSSPSYRLVIDMGDLDGATILQVTGQSGVPFDSHYGDFIYRWLANTPLPLPWSRSAVDAAQVQALTLQP